MAYGGGVRSGADVRTSTPLIRPNTGGFVGRGDNLLGEDPDVFSDLSDNCFAHGCCSLRFTARAEVLKVKVGAVVDRVVGKEAFWVHHSEESDTLLVRSPRSPLN